MPDVRPVRKSEFFRKSHVSGMQRNVSGMPKCTGHLKHEKSIVETTLFLEGKKLQISLLHRQAVGYVKPETSTN